MSCFSYKGKGFEISRAQAVQAVAARCQVSPDMNPILLKPLGSYYSTVFLHGKRLKKMHASRYYKEFALTRGLKISLDSLRRLQDSYDLVILEGAGSPVEINLEKYDIANMRIASEADSPVLLISDIDRGGSFASMAGTLWLLNPKYRDLVAGFVINKFRGNIDILKPGLRKLARITGKPVLGTIPMADFDLPEEDSLGTGAKPFVWNQDGLQKLDQEIAKVARLVEKNLNIGKIVKLAK